MAMPEIDTKILIEAGVHFGHRKHMWDPKMQPYLFGVKQDTHILDLTQTEFLMRKSLNFVRDVVANSGRVLFVGTKRQAAEKIAETAQRCAQYYINQRWFGGTLTNWQTISISINRLKELESNIEAGYAGLTKKETLDLKREMQRLQRALGGVKDMGGIPDVLFVIDTNREKNAVAEAVKLGIPIVAVIDSNCSPDFIDYPIPGNDDSRKSIALYCDLMAEAVFEGLAIAQKNILKEVDEQPGEQEQTAKISVKSDKSNVKTEKITAENDEVIETKDDTDVVAASDSGNSDVTDDNVRVENNSETDKTTENEIKSSESKT